MVKHADLLIFDLINIKKHIKEDYKKYNSKLHLLLMVLM